MAAQFFQTGSFIAKSEFARDDRGSVAVIFGLMLLAFTMVAGVAIDYGRLHHTKSRLVSAADAAALAGGSALLDGRLSDAEIETLAKNYFQKNLEEGGGLFGTVTSPNVIVNRATGEVHVDATATVPMAITKLAGFKDVTIPVESDTGYDLRDIELGIALDVTGSMRGRKISDLKTAAKDLIDILMPDGARQNRVRIGLAPYAASVNAGSYASVVTGYSGRGHTCVHERSGSQKFTDAAPTGIDKLGRNNRMSCPSARILPLSEDKALLKKQIDGLSASGNTAGHLGAAWAWYLVSPVWDSIWPAASKPVAYNDGKTMKAVILMTDGMFNQAYVSGNGNSTGQARSVCTEMKAKGVTVYSIAFQAPGSAQSLLQDCSSGSSYYYAASNGGELRQAFQKIAKTLNNLRLTN